MESWIFALFVSLAFIAVGIYKIIDYYKNKNTRLQIYYLGGHPKLKGPKLIYVKPQNNNLLIHDIELLKTDIKEIKFIPHSDSSNVLAGAALGGLLLGPAGAFAGAAMSGSNPANGNLIQLTYNEAGISYELFFGGKDIMNQYPMLKQMIAV
ncbi:hypothetical protein DCMF_04710 [Candidatus Formimonas warabiya]|uniref:Uncharacterized protein n=2 Tax=Formimonas warabiya TaxID=1761012 RepID=A0A3G1KNY7_FORW1|nr:hypothetical protein DCMF_04710 [Candidatus Formimonas warabiya]